MEICNITLKPGYRLERWNFDVLTYGPSLHDGNMYDVIRRYDILPQPRLSTGYAGGDLLRDGKLCRSCT
jgi:hypothetical protein